MSAYGFWVNKIKLLIYLRYLNRQHYIWYGTHPLLKPEQGVPLQSGRANQMFLIITGAEIVEKSRKFKVEMRKETLTLNITHLKGVLRMPPHQLKSPS